MLELLLSISFYLIAIFCPFFSAVLYYLTQEGINSLIEKNYKAAQRLRDLKIEYDELINSFIIFEIISYILSFSFLTVFLHNLTFQTDFSFHEIFWISSVVYIVLVLLGRFFLQAIGIRFADSIAGTFSMPMNFFSIGLKPITSVIKTMSKSIVGSPNVEESREEISELVESAHEEGAIEQSEYRILKNIMHFSEILVSDVMTPRTVVFSLSADKTVEEVIKLPELQMYSRFPIWEGDSVDDGIIGYIMSKDVLLAALNGKNNIKIREFSREIYFIPEKAELDKALERFLNRRQHMSMVVDEYGGIEGLITMEDVFETILGVEIVDEVDKVVDLRQLAKQRRDSRIASL